MSSHPLHNKSAVKRPQLSDWAWRPWYAKLWWSLIAAYWTGGAGAFLFHPVADFYTSRFAGYLGIALYPVFALAILSIGWVRAWVGALDYAAENPEIENTLGSGRRSRMPSVTSCVAGMTLQTQLVRHLLPMRPRVVCLIAELDYLLPSSRLFGRSSEKRPLSKIDR
jgi:hypothetical protein